MESQTHLQLGVKEIIGILEALDKPGQQGGGGRLEGVIGGPEGARDIRSMIDAIDALNRGLGGEGRENGFLTEDREGHEGLEPSRGGGCASIETRRFSFFGTPLKARITLVKVSYLQVSRPL